MFKLPKVYPVTDNSISGLSIPQQVQLLISAGATLIQVRAKDISDRELYDAVVTATALTRETRCRLIVNDRVDIARLAGADGVHLGQTDISPAIARELLRPDAIIGLSTHSLVQLDLALRQPIDYIAFGPIFPTSSKKAPDPAVGSRALGQAIGLVGNTPLVAIGGINFGSIDEVLESGADSAAMISGIWIAQGLIEPRIVEYLT